MTELDRERPRHALQARLRCRVVDLPRLPSAEVDDNNTIFP